MANQILLNFAVPFTEISGVTPVSTSYLRKAAVVVEAKSFSQGSTITECVDMVEVAAITDNKNAKGFFDGGLNKVFVISLAGVDADTPPKLEQVNAILKENENKFFTLHLSNDFTDAEIKTTKVEFDGVISAELGIQADSKEFAVSHCAGLSTLETKGEGVCYALGKLLSTLTKWSNQQYINYGGSSSIETVSSIGTAESLFDDRVTFWISDEEQGTKLSFFACGGRAITEKYVSEELKLFLQNSALNYIATNAPFNTLEMRVNLQNELQSVINGYVDEDYLNPEGDNEITVTESSQMFFVDGNLSVDHSVPVWRMAITAIKE